MSHFMFWGFTSSTQDALECEVDRDELILNKLQCGDACANRIISDMSKMQRIVNTNYIRSLKHILSLDVMRLLLSASGLKLLSDNNYLLDTTRHMLRFVQNDRRWLMKLLCYDKKKTLFMSICGSNDENLVDFMNEIVLNNTVLSRNDIDSLLLMRDDK
eukprot:336013_1